MNFEFNFTLDQFKACVPNNPEPNYWFNAFYDYLPMFYITTTSRVAGFIAQCQHESGDFNVLQENLNYSASGLMRTFGKYFPTQELANQYARKPQMIANKVYGGRLGNGPESSGDGWKFRGRGLIQLTGRANYTQCSKDLFQDISLANDPDLVRTPEYAVIASCWFWHKNQLNYYCDRGDIVGLSRRVNGGDNGLEDRIENWNRALGVLEGE